MPAPLFRFARQDDVGALVRLIERAYRGPETAGQWDSESHLLTGPRTSTEEVSGLVANVDSRVLVAELDGQIVGCALIQKTKATGMKSDQLARDAAYFGMFATDPGIRTEGLGKQVLAEAERQVRDLWGAKAMNMTVINLRTGLIAWYERRGYWLTGGGTPFPFSETSGETRRDFHLVEMRKDFG